MRIFRDDLLRIELNIRRSRDQIQPNNSLARALPSLSSRFLQRHVQARERVEIIELRCDRIGLNERTLRLEILVRISSSWPCSHKVCRSEASGMRRIVERSALDTVSTRHHANGREDAGGLYPPMTVFIDRIALRQLSLVSAVSYTSVSISETKSRFSRLFLIRRSCSLNDRSTSVNGLPSTTIRPRSMCRSWAVSGRIPARLPGAEAAAEFFHALSVLFGVQQLNALVRARWFLSDVIRFR